MLSLPHCFFYNPSTLRLDNITCSVSRKSLPTMGAPGQAVKTDCDPKRGRSLAYPPPTSISRSVGNACIYCVGLRLVACSRCVKSMIGRKDHITWQYGRLPIAVISNIGLYGFQTSSSAPIPHRVVVPVPAIVSTAKKFITGFSLRLRALRMSCPSSPPRIAAVGANS